MEKILRNQNIIYNIGLFIAGFTFFVCSWYVILHMPFAAINGIKGVIFYFFGIFCVITLAILPYLIFYVVVSRVRYPIFLWGIIVGFFCGDLIIRLGLVFSLSYIFGFFALGSYSLLFCFVVLFVWFSDHIIYKCTVQCHNYCKAKIESTLHKITTLFSRKRKI